MSQASLQITQRGQYLDSTEILDPRGFTVSLGVLDETLDVGRNKLTLRHDQRCEEVAVYFQKSDDPRWYIENASGENELEIKNLQQSRSFFVQPGKDLRLESNDTIVCADFELTFKLPEAAKSASGAAPPSPTSTESGNPESAGIEERSKAKPGEQRETKPANVPETPNESASGPDAEQQHASSTEQPGSLDASGDAKGKRKSMAEGDTIPIDPPVPPAEKTKSAPEAKAAPKPTAKEQSKERPAQHPTQRSKAPPKPATPIKPVEPVAVTLPNGMVGNDYEAPLELVKGFVNPPRIRESGVSQEHAASHEQTDQQLSNGLQLEARGDALFLTGTPTQDGDREFTVVYDQAEKPNRLQKYRLFINPDPRSLWKNEEPDPSKPYQKPNSDRRALHSDASRLIAASVRGRSHAHEGGFRDDDFELETQDGWDFLVVSDGAGSARYSRKGSEIICNVMRDTVLSNIEQLDRLLATQPASGIEQSALGDIKVALYEVLGRAGKTAFEAVCTEAEKPSEDSVQDASLSDYAATVVCCTYKKFEFGWFFAAFAIGDGGVAVFTKDGPLKVLNQPDGGEYAGQTRFATMSHIWDSDQEISTRIQVCRLPEFTAVVAMTDGVSDPKFGTDKDFFSDERWGEFWQDVTAEVDLNGPTADAELLAWLDFWSPGNHDDRTIAIGIPKHG